MQKLQDIRKLCSNISIYVLSNLNKTKHSTVILDKTSTHTRTTKKPGAGRLYVIDIFGVHHPLCIPSSSRLCEESSEARVWIECSTSFSPLLPTSSSFHTLALKWSQKENKDRTPARINLTIPPVITLKPLSTLHSRRSETRFRRQFRRNNHHRRHHHLHRHYHHLQQHQHTTTLSHIPTSTRRSVQHRRNSTPYVEEG